MGAFFILQSETPHQASPVVISGDAKDIAMLIGILWNLIEGRNTEVRLSELGSFDRVNLAEIVFLRSDVSQFNFDGAELKIQADEQHLEIYSSSLEELINTPNGHQYLDAAKSNVDIDLVVSIGEHPNSLVERLTQQRPRGH